MRLRFLPFCFLGRFCMKRRLPDPLLGFAAGRFFIVPLCILAWFAFLAEGLAATPAPAPPIYDDEEETPWMAKMPPGEKAARKACTICHQFVEPKLLDKKNWKEQILPRMSVRLGVALPDWSSSPEGELIKSRKVYTDRPLVPVEDWPLIERWYLESAPDTALPQDPRPRIEVGLKGFRTEPARFRTPTPATTLVKIVPESRHLFVGDERTGTIYILDSEGVKTAELDVANVPTDLVVRSNGLYVTAIGTFMPSEIYRGEFLLFPRQGAGYGARKVLLSQLPRPTMARFADFNGDGKEDIALCMFGNLTGRFSWFEALGDDQYREHILSSKAGSIVVDICDLNGDGKPDLGVQMAQELETLVLMNNDGKGQFTGDVVFQSPPVYGNNYFEFADFNKDGKPDLLVVNGDNGEYESPLKKYHGIRIYLNQGRGQFAETSFFPMNGCYKAVARDFDGDGDLDIAAISYFPDYVGDPRESFVYLENTGDLKFAPTTFRECISGRWLVMDVGDLDGDGDLDIVLGSHIAGPKAVPQMLLDTWTKQGPSVRILRNLQKERQAGVTGPPSASSAPAVQKP